MWSDRRKFDPVLSTQPARHNNSGEVTTGKIRLNLAIQLNMHDIPFLNAVVILKSVVPYLREHQHLSYSFYVTFSPKIRFAFWRSFAPFGELVIDPCGQRWSCSHQISGKIGRESLVVDFVKIFLIITSVEFVVSSKENHPKNKNSASANPVHVGGG
jgi:hypothetical protein